MREIEFKYVWLILAAGLLAFTASSAEAKLTTIEEPGLNIIPQPVRVERQTGTYTLPADAVITFDGPGELRKIAEKLLANLSVATSRTPSIAKYSVAVPGDIVLKVLSDKRPSLGTEGYVLEITPRQVNISANAEAGLFYGVQTLMQLVSDAAQSHGSSAIQLPAVFVEDYPRFAYRGMLLDVAHHFFGKQCVEEFIDQMAMFKYNRLQLHMTNDNGWRIEIKQYPKLTEVGAWRVPRTGPWHTYDHLPPLDGEACTDGGYFTQDDIRHIVQYAAERYVEIVPGIELPGHMLALIAAYPETSCTGEQYHVNPGTRRYWSIKGAEPDIPYEMCAGRDSNFLMLENILDEYIALFPSEYIHIGGDEAMKDFWKTCERCQKRMKDEGLENVDELQSYFVTRIEQYLNSKGKKLIGWDEILDGGLAPNATVMSWRGMAGGIKSAQMGHDVIMAPNTFTYFDYRQRDPSALPKVTRWGYLPIEKVYEFEPVPEGIDEKYILGGQGCLWSEFIRTCDENAYQAWPRGMALAETLWSPTSTRDLSALLAKLPSRFSQLEKSGIHYSDAVYDPAISPALDADSTLTVRLTTLMPGLDIHYTFNDHIPTKFASKYSGEPLSIPKGASRLMVASIRDGVQQGAILDITVAELMEKAKKQIKKN